MSPPKRVAVIGAGAAGLATTRQLKRAGLSPVVFEAEATLGGTWVYSDETESDPLSIDPRRRRVHTSMYRNLRTNLPRDLMAFREYPFDVRGGADTSWPRFPAHEEVLTYLRRYAEHFDLQPHIRFRTTVETVVPLDPDGDRWTDPSDVGTWLVRSTSPGGASEEEQFEAVAVCNGHFSVPNVPDLPGAAAFGGVRLHSHNYRQPEDFAGKRVVLLGGRASGIDIAIEVAEFASRTLLSVRDARAGRSLPGCEDISVCAGIDRFDGNDLVLADGGRIEAVDVVLYCTGYRYAVPFVNEPAIVCVDDGWIHPLYLDLFSAVAPSLGFIGLGNMIIPFPQYELQAAAFAAVTTGAKSLPDRMERERLARSRELALRRAGTSERYFLTQGDRQFAYNDLLAEHFDLAPITPSFEKLHHAVEDARANDAKHYRSHPLPWLDDEYERAAETQWW
ncbi:MAG: NAD(P)-binding domain-containing protein [Acidimicrobiales bacterium]